MSQTVRCPAGAMYDPVVHAVCPCLSCWAERSAAMLQSRTEAVELPALVRSALVVAEPVAPAAAPERVAAVPPPEQVAFVPPPQPAAPAAMPVIVVTDPPAEAAAGPDATAYSAFAGGWSATPVAAATAPIAPIAPIVRQDNAEPARAKAAAAGNSNVIQLGQLTADLAPAPRTRAGAGSSVKSTLALFFSFRGSIGRAEYTGLLGCVAGCGILASLVIALDMSFTNTREPRTAAIVIGCALALLTVTSFCAIQAKRLHDLGASAIWALVVPALWFAAARALPPVLLDWVLSISTIAIVIALAVIPGRAASRARTARRARQ